MGGEQQHQQNNHYGNDHDHLHLRVQIGRVIRACAAGDVQIVPGQGFLDLGQGLEADVFVCRAVVCNGE